MPAHRIALIVSLLPLFTIHASYLISATYENVPWCFPYGLDCSSISASGRHPPAVWLFKPLMISAAVFMLFYWQLCLQYLKQLEVQAPKRYLAILILGILAPLFLMLYTTFLGEVGQQYRELRRIGITFSFTFSYLNQLMFTSCLLASAQSSHNILWGHRINILLLALGILSVCLDVVLGKTYDRMENGFEWTFALLMGMHAFLIYREWKQTGFRISFTIGRA